jgi:hypothetical protein
MRSRSRRLDVGWAAALGMTTCLAYLPGASRAFDYDGSVTVPLFIRAPFGAALNEQYVFNNHPYFSFLEQIVSRAVGSSSEATLRVLPILLAGAAVGLLAFVACRQYGLLPGTCAAAILATNPLFLTESREVRGYSLLVLCAVISTTIVAKTDGKGGLWRWGYVLSIGVGLGTHLFMIWVIAGHAVILWHRRQDRSEWLFRMVGGGLIGAVPYLLTLDEFVGRSRHRHVDAGFPIALARDLLGTEWISVGLVGSLLAFALWRCRRHRLLAPLVAVAVIAVLTTLFSPNAPGTRFFIWAVPLVGLGSASAVHTRRLLSLLVVPAVAVQLLSVHDTYTRDSLANRRVAPLIERSRREGKRVCGLGGSTETLPVYVGYIPELFDPSELTRCDVVVVVVPRFEPALVRTVRRRFRFRHIVPATTSALLFAREPIAE